MVQLLNFPGLKKRLELEPRFGRAFVEMCERLGLVPMLTLHHFTNPKWLADEGGISSPSFPDRFLRRQTFASVDTIVDALLQMGVEPGTP